MVLQTVRLKSDKMATENSTLPVSGEHLDSSVVEDTQNNSVPADGGETNAAVADDTDVPTQSRVDFADEDAAFVSPPSAGTELFCVSSTTEESRCSPETGRVEFSVAILSDFNLTVCKTI
jgi:hypothetical protein